jgi:hypothetical protein
MLAWHAIRARLDGLALLVLLQPQIRGVRGTADGDAKNVLRIGVVVMVMVILLQRIGNGGGSACGSSISGGDINE